MRRREAETTPAAHMPCNTHAMQKKRCPCHAMHVFRVFSHASPCHAMHLHAMHNPDNYEQVNNQVNNGFVLVTLENENTMR